MQGQRQAVALGSNRREPPLEQWPHKHYWAVLVRKLDRSVAGGIGILGCKPVGRCRNSSLILSPKVEVRMPLFGVQTDLQIPTNHRSVCSHRQQHVGGFHLESPPNVVDFR